ncbi:MAG: hypothetical protein ACUVWP_05455 [bacterium]
MKVVFLTIPVVALICSVLIPIGYGTDIDNYRVMLSSKTLITEGRYEPSRNFGYPLNELIMAPFYAIGKNIATNTATLIIFIISIFIFYKLGKRFNMRHPELLTLTYALHPLLLKNATVPLDHIWSLLFIVSALILLKDEKVIIASLSLAIAVGFRPTNIIFIIPSIIIIKDWSERVKFSIITIAVSMFFYIFPTIYFMKNQVNIITGGDKSILHILQTSLSLFGNIGWLIIIIIAIIYLIYYLKRKDHPFEFRDNIMLSVFILANITIFIIYPYEVEYLIPLVPAILILISKRVSKHLLIALFVAVVSYNLVWFDITQNGILIKDGVIKSQITERTHLEYERNNLPELDVEEPSLVITALGEALYFDNEKVEIVSNNEVGVFDGKLIKSRTKNIYFIYLGSEEYIKKMVNNGYHIHYLPYARKFTISVYRYDLTKYGDELNI